MGRGGPVFGVGEFRVLFGANVASVAGDQLARVALAVLVFGRTGSAAWTAGTYALTFLPALLGGLLLSWTADRLRRREVMVGADLLRAAGIGAMAVPGLPLWLLCTLLVCAVLLGAPHAAAQSALLPEILPGELYERGLAVRQIAGQTAQLAGFAFGGLLVAAIGPPAALLVDAATFLASAVIVRAGVRDRPAAAPDGEGVAGGARAVVAGIVTIATDPPRRALVALAWTVGAFVVPEGLAAPYAAQLGHGTAVVGLLMAADPLGSVIGAWAFTRFVPAVRRERLIGVVAAMAGLPLVVVAAHPGPVLTVVLWGLSGACSTAYLLQTQASFVRATPAALRGSAIGVAASGIVASQGVAVLAGGLLADATGAAAAIALCGGLGSVLAVVGAVVLARAGAGDRTPSGVASRP